MIPRPPGHRGVFVRLLMACASWSHSLHLVFILRALEFNDEVSASKTLWRSNILWYCLTRDIVLPKRTSFCPHNLFKNWPGLERWVLNHLTFKVWRTELLPFNIFILMKNLMPGWFTCLEVPFSKICLVSHPRTSPFWLLSPLELLLQT